MGVMFGFFVLVLGVCVALWLILCCVVSVGVNERLFRWLSN